MRNNGAIALALQTRHQRESNDPTNDRGRQQGRAVLAAPDDDQTQKHECQECGPRCAEHKRVAHRTGYTGPQEPPRCRVEFDKEMQQRQRHDDDEPQSIRVDNVVGRAGEPVHVLPVAE